MVSKKLGEEEIKNMFSQFGAIEDCTVLRDDNGISRGEEMVNVTSRAKSRRLRMLQKVEAGQSNSINVRLDHFKRVHPCENCNVMFNEKEAPVLLRGAGEL